MLLKTQSDFPTRICHACVDVLLMFFDTQCSLVPVTSSASLCNDLLLLSLVTGTISDLLLLLLMLVISDKMESLNDLKSFCLQDGLKFLEGSLC